MDAYLQINQCDSPSNKMNDKNHMIISIHAENHLTKFKINYDKKLSKSEYRRNIPPHNRGYYGN